MTMTLSWPIESHQKTNLVSNAQRLLNANKTQCSKTEMLPKMESERKISLKQQERKSRKYFTIIVSYFWGPTPEKSWVNHILVVQFMYLITCLNYIPRQSSSPSRLRNRLVNRGRVQQFLTPVTRRQTNISTIKKKKKNILCVMYSMCVFCIVQ